MKLESEIPTELHQPEALRLEHSLTVGKTSGAIVEAHPVNDRPLELVVFWFSGGEATKIAKRGCVIRKEMWCGETNRLNTREVGRYS
jgi:hypothetical protein